MEKYNWYQEILKDHYYRPRNKGIIDAPHFVYTLKNPSCGDSVTFAGTIENKCLKTISFLGEGCVMSQAAASLLSEKVLGLTFIEILNLAPAYMQEIVGIPIGPVRMKCVVLPLTALQKGVGQYAQSNSAYSSM